MKKIFLALLTIMIMTTFVEGLSSKQKADVPQVTVMIPRDGQTLVGDAMTFQVLTNVKIRSSRGINKPNEGYLKVVIDSDAPIKVTSPTYRINIKNLLGGKHTLSAELVQNNGKSFEPAVVRTITFSVSRSALRQGNQLKVKKQVHPARLFDNRRI